MLEFFMGLIIGALIGIGIMAFTISSSGADNEKKDK